MLQEIIMTKQEQVDMYMKCSKKELCEMLIEANKHLKKQLTLTDVVKSFDCGNNRVNGDVKCLEQCGECKECYN